MEEDQYFDLDSGQSQSGQNILRCVACQTGSEIWPLEIACDCPQRRFHYRCLPEYLTATLDRVCPYCQTRLRNIRLRRFMKKSTFGNLFINCMIRPSLWFMITAMVVLYYVNRHMGHPNDNLIPIYGFILAIIVSHLRREFDRHRNSRPNSMIEFNDVPIPGTQSTTTITIDMTLEVERHNQLQEALRAEEWFRHLNEQVAELPLVDRPVEVDWGTVGYKTIKTEKELLDEID